MHAFVGALALGAIARINWRPSPTPCKLLLAPLNTRAGYDSFAHHGLPRAN